MNKDEIFELVSEYYDFTVSTYGPTPKGVDWRDHSSQMRRLENLLEIVDTDKSFSILDYGCGYGALLDLLNQNYPHFTYFGTDLSKNMMNLLRSRLIDQENVFAIDLEQARKKEYDFVLASGVFNIMFSGYKEWEEYVYHSLDVLFQLSRMGYATNFLSSYSDESYQKANLYYMDPEKVLKYVLQNHSKKVRVIHEADLYDFSVLVYHL